MRGEGGSGGRKALVIPDSAGCWHAADKAVPSEARQEFVKNFVGVDSADRILESALQSQGYQVTQPDSSTQTVLDKGPETFVTFAPDAGLGALLIAKRRELLIVGCTLTD